MLDLSAMALSGRTALNLLEMASSVRLGLGRDVVVVQRGLVAGSDASGVEILGHGGRESWVIGSEE